MSHEIMLGVQICNARWKQDPPNEGTVEEVAKQAFRLVRDETWFTTHEDTIFRIGCGVLLMHYRGTPIRDQLENSIKVLQCLSAAASGIPVDWEALLEGDGLPLLAWFRETT